ncbi:MAG: sn-glycerol-3-phosphate ABC transporter ATP-binding protein UgpC [Planctomycetota bacterium]|jgi:multiple sugar transport system ATP-binding protein|nr:sn-glycerol-3-phosphate ABC transporter ATP-binding protein UgpC [Planctomycetota bacterium]
MEFIHIKDFRKIYDDNVAVLNNFNLDVRENEFVVLLGPSGCGKSTLLRMIAGLENITAGDLYIAGKRVNDARPRERNIAMVFQNYALYPHMNVYDNIAFGLRRMKMSEGEMQRRVEDASGLLGISEFHRKRPDQLSGGQQQRVAIARAIVKTPQVFLFDEPLSNLDAKLRNSLRGEIKKLHIKLNTTTIYVTHDQLEAMTLADRIVLMRNGKIEQAGTPDEIYNKPESMFTAGFIGTPQINFFPVEIQGEGNRPVAVGDGLRMPLPPESFNLNIGQKVVIGIRPSHIEMVGRNDGGAVATRVDMLENMGEETLVSFTLGSTPGVFLVLSDRAPNRSEEIFIRFMPNKLHVFVHDSSVSLRRKIG